MGNFVSHATYRERRGHNRCLQACAPLGLSRSPSLMLGRRIIHLHQNPRGRDHHKFPELALLAGPSPNGGNEARSSR